MRTEILYGLVVFAISCSFVLFSHSLFLKLYRKAGIRVPYFRLSGVPLVLSMVLSLLVASILFPSLFMLMDFPLELLAGAMMVFLLGVACDVGTPNGRLRLFVLLFSSLAFPLSGIVVKGALGAIFTVCYVVAFCAMVNLIEKHYGYGTILLISLQTISLILFWKTSDWSFFLSNMMQSGALSGFLGLKYYYLSTQKKIILGESGILTASYLTAILCMRMIL